MDSDNPSNFSSSFKCQLTLPWDLALQYLSLPSYSQHLLPPSLAPHIPLIHLGVQ